MGGGADTTRHRLDALAPLPLICRKMFGEYAPWLDGKLVALDRNDQLFPKPSPSAQAALPGRPEGQPCPGAKLHLLSTDALDDPHRAAKAPSPIASDLPAPKPAKSRI